MKRNGALLLSVVGLLMISAGGAMADESNDLRTAITSGKVGLNVRTRYEHVDQDGVAKDADALTARLRLNYRTGQWMGWSGFGEFDYVLHAIDDFNSGGGTSPNRVQYAVVADPEDSDLNQLYLDYKATDNTDLRIGRQRILLDNQRFVGGVGWRQNEQTYDALTLTTKAIANTALQYSYVADVRRIFGEGVAAGSDKTSHHLVNAKISLRDDWSVVPYIYLLDYDFTEPVPALPLDQWGANDRRRALSSTATAGARLAGNIKAGDGKIALLAEFATQSDAGDNPVNYDAQYAHLSAMWVLDTGLSLGIAYETLGADSGNLQSFRTPLATAHAFQGWADKFLTTPAAGIEDLFLTVKYKAGNWNLTGVYHDFSADTGGGDFGTEFDLSAATKLYKQFGLLFKGAFFSTDSLAYEDTNKFWIMFTADY